MSQTIPSADPQIGMVRSSLFAPYYSPNDMLALGVFGGSFFGSNKAAKMLGTMPAQLFNGVGPVKWANQLYQQAQNYFNVTLPATDRGFNMPMNLKRLHPFGWFQWYCQWYYGQLSPADDWRIKQWQNQLNVQWFYINQGPYTGDGNQFTDLTFLPQRRQRLLEFGWDPTVSPASKGLQINF